MTQRTNTENLLSACERFIAEWPNFCRHIDFNHSNLDAESIQFFNEVPGLIKKWTEEMRKIDIGV